MTPLPESSYREIPEANPEREERLRRQRILNANYRKNNPERRRETEEQWRAQNREHFVVMRRAHQYIHRAVESGLLVRPTECETCHTPCRAEAHHEDYSKPLEVVWLCRRCHRKANLARKARLQ